MLYLSSAPDDSSPPQPQNGSITKVAEDLDQTKSTPENARDVDTAKNTKEEKKDDKNNKTKDIDEKIKAIAEKALNTFLPAKKIELIKELGQHGKPAIPYIVEIADKSLSPRVKKRALEDISDINKQSEESGDA